MTDTPNAAISPPLPGSPERGEASVKHTFVAFDSLLQMPSIFFYVPAGFFVVCLLGFTHKAPFLSLSGILLILAVGIVFTCLNYFKGMHFIVYHRPYAIGDLIEVEPTGSDASFKKESIWRVKSFALFYTELVSLSSGAQISWPNGDLANRRVIRNWSSSPAKFAIIVQVPVNTCDRDGRLLLQQIHEKVEQYANDNPGKWSAVNMITADAVTVGNEHKQYCIEIQHCKAYKELDVVFDSYDKLSVYLQDQMQAGRLNNKKPGKDSKSTLSIAAGDNDELKIDCPEEETMRNEQEEGDVEGGNNNDDDSDRRVNYQIFIRSA